MTKQTTTQTIACTRCNGVGEYTWMTSQGWTSGTCFRCGGCGIDPNPVQAAKKVVRDAEAQAKHEALMADIAAKKEEREAAEAIATELRWARQAVEIASNQIAKAEAAGDLTTVNLLRTTLMPIVEARLAKAEAEAAK